MASGTPTKPMRLSGCLIVLAGFFFVAAHQSPVIEASAPLTAVATTTSGMDPVNN